MREYLDTAIRSARLSSEIILTNLGKLDSKDVDTKQASDFVTRVDREAEAAIIAMISMDYPEHSILAEESSEDLGDTGYRWIVDPLDGTTNYIHGYPMFCVSIALALDGHVIMGVVHDPLREETFTAVKGGGTFLNGKKVTVAEFCGMERTLVATGFPFKQKDKVDLYLDVFKKIFAQVSDIRRAGSAALDFSHLAAGRLDGFFEIGLGPWDIAAGSILIKEAGGIITDFSGGDDYLKTGNVVAGVAEVHEVLLTQTQSVFSGTIDK